MKKGSKMTDEQKKKISESGKNAWNLERRKKMSDEYKGLLVLGKSKLFCFMSSNQILHMGQQCKG